MVILLFRKNISQLYRIVILPDIYIQKTIQGVRECRNEIFEKVIKTQL